MSAPSVFKKLEGKTDMHEFLTFFHVMLQFMILDDDITIRTKVVEYPIYRDTKRE